MGLCPHVHPYPVILQFLSMSLQGLSCTWDRVRYNKLNNPVISAVTVFQFTELGESTSLWKLSSHGQVFKGSDHKSAARSANNFMLLVSPLRRTRQNQGASWPNDPRQEPIVGKVELWR